MHKNWVAVWYSASELAFADGVKVLPGGVYYLGACRGDQLGATPSNKFFWGSDFDSERGKDG